MTSAIITGFTLAGLLYFGPFGCTRLITRPEFKVGDCVTTDQDGEVWEENEIYFIKKILVVGKKNYHVQYVIPRNLSVPKYNDSMPFSYERFYSKVNCPKD